MEKIIDGLTLKIDKLDSYLNDYYLETDDNVYLFFKWILGMKEHLIPNTHQENLVLWSYNSYLKQTGLEDTDTIREHPKSSDLGSILNQWDNPKLSPAELGLIRWLMDSGLDEVTTRETHQIMMWPVRIAYSQSSKRDGRVLLPGEK